MRYNIAIVHRRLYAAQSKFLTLFSDKTVNMRHLVLPFDASAFSAPLNSTSLIFNLSLEAAKEINKEFKKIKIHTDVNKRN